MQTNGWPAPVAASDSRCEIRTGGQVYGILPAARRSALFLVDCLRGGGDGLQEPGGVGNPLLGPAPFVSSGADLELDPGAVEMALFTGDPVGDAARLGAVAEHRVHVW